MVATSGPGWRLAPSLVFCEAEINHLYPNRPKLSDGSIGDTDHAARESDHNPHVWFDQTWWVTALDITDWDPRFDVDGWLEDLRVARDDRLKYGISDGRFFSSYSTSTRRAWEWAPYTGPNGHFQHVHLSVLPTRAGIYDRSTWFPKRPPNDEPEDDDMQVIYKSNTGTVLYQGGKLLAVTNQATLSQYQQQFPTIDLTKDDKQWQRIRKAHPTVSLDG